MTQISSYPVTFTHERRVKEEAWSFSIEVVLFKASAHSFKRLLQGF